MNRKDVEQIIRQYSQAVMPPPATLSADTKVVFVGGVIAALLSDMDKAREALRCAKAAINGREHTGFIDEALAQLERWKK